VMDNLGSHKGAEANEAAGAAPLYLPPYSPDFNPIAKALSKFKSLLRKAAERNVDARDYAETRRSATQPARHLLSGRSNSRQIA
jgi:transposase